ncbi:energy-coupling factor transporter transmembrane component T [Herpetosiphon sp. NSE202]|uniref:energy-coupling factor transporter transmembrane component T n=1 Tax=Herpetosiphon sp. NSE202 TaxID=3351349 RepID=UPI003644E051
MSSEVYQPATGRAREALNQVEPATASKEWSSQASQRQRRIARPWEGGHSLAWVAWLIAALACISQTDQPLYLGLISAVTLVIWQHCALDSPFQAVVRVMLQLGGVLFGFNLLFSVITASVLRGQTVLFELPSWRLPQLLGGIQLGGLITAEQLASGAVRGLRLWTLLLVVGTFNACVNHYRLLRRTPQGFFQLGLVLTISLAFIPQTLLRLRAIRDAQRLRGHRFRSWRDALPLFVPLLSGGLEQSLTLAEAMEAHGFGRTQRGKIASRWTWLGLAGVMLVCAGVWALFFYRTGSTAAMLGWLGLALGLLAMLSYWWQANRLIVRSSYRREQWTRQATIITLLAALAPLGFWLARRSGIAMLYKIYPKVTWPPFEPIVAIAILALLAPLLFKASAR